MLIRLSFRMLSRYSTYQQLPVTSSPSMHRSGLRITQLLSWLRGKDHKISPVRLALCCLCIASIAVVISLPVALTHRSSSSIQQVDSALLERVFRGRPISEEAAALLPPITVPAFPIRIDKPANYSYLTIPSSTDPWPERTWIAQEWLRSDRAVLPPPPPSWPTDTRLPIQPKMIPYESFTFPENRTIRPDGMGRKKKLAKVQVMPNESDEQKVERGRRREWVTRAIRHGWEGYKKHAWGHDQVNPISKTFKDNFDGFGATLVDSLDLLLLLGWEEDYAYARTHAHALDFTRQAGTPSGQQADILTFETTIRYLGGFLSAYDLSGDVLMLKRAKELGDWMIGAFNTHQGLPSHFYKFGSNLRGKKAGTVVLAEVGSMSLEFTRLAQITGERKYFDVVQRVTEWVNEDLRAQINHEGLLPLFFDEDVTTNDGAFTFGGQADSYYEYLIKEHILLGGSIDEYATMYSEAVDTASNYIMSDISAVPGQKLFTLGRSQLEEYIPRLEHLTCFAGGMLALGAKVLDRPGDLYLAKRFTETCVWAYNVTASGLSPEILDFYNEADPDLYLQESSQAEEPYLVPQGSPAGVSSMPSKDYRGRPETIESVFYMWRLTGEQEWQDKGWSMFHALVDATIVEGGFAAVSDVTVAPPPLVDSCESFFYAETLKYYYLLFADHDVLSLDEYVFSTEAHPFSLAEVSEKPHLFSMEAKKYLQFGDGDEHIGKGTAAQLQG